MKKHGMADDCETVAAVAPASSPVLVAGQFARATPSLRGSRATSDQGISSLALTTRRLVSIQSTMSKEKKAPLASTPAGPELLHVDDSVGAEPVSSSRSHSGEYSRPLPQREVTGTIPPVDDTRPGAFAVSGPGGAVDNGQDDGTFTAESFQRRSPQDQLDKNDIGSTLPSTLGVMTSLDDIEIEENKLSGRLPTELGLMAALGDLRIKKNSLSGTIPTEMALMASLKVLRLATNNLVGSISPTMIGSLQRLVTLKLEENGFTGSVPSEIGLLTALELLELGRNNLDGQ